MLTNTIKDGHEGGTKKKEDEEATAKKGKKQDQNVPEVHMLSVSPLHVDEASQQDTIKINDVFDDIVQNINPLKKNDLKMIL